MKVSELEGKFTALGDQVDKIAVEVQALKDALANSDTELPAAAQAALDRLSAALQAADDINADAQPPA